MELLILKDIEHTPGFWLRAGKRCNVWDSIARKYVKAGLAVDVNNVMGYEPLAKEAPAPESTGAEGETEAKKQVKQKNKEE